MAARARRPRTGRATPEVRTDDTTPPGDKPGDDEHLAATPPDEPQLGGPDTQPAYRPGREPRP